MYKNTNQNESYKLDEAIEYGFVIGKRIELEKIDAIFQHQLNFTVNRLKYYNNFFYFTYNFLIEGTS